MMSPDNMAPLRQSLNHGILDQLADALLQCTSLDQFNRPVLRLEAFVQEGDRRSATSGEPSLVASVNSIRRSNRSNHKILFC